MACRSHAEAQRRARTAAGLLLLLLVAANAVNAAGAASAAAIEAAVEASPLVGWAAGLDALGDRHGAVAAWRAALDCTPRDVQAYAALARLQMLAGDPDAARAGLARALELARQRAADAPEADGS